MAGHSQFKNIMHRKGKQDKVRSKLFAKLAREITVSAKIGLPDPAFNPRLRAAIIAARAENMPKDNIERAIKKAQGADAESYDEIRYEGYGPGGVAVIVEALDRQSQPHRRRSARHLHQERRQPRRRPARCRSCSIMSAWSNTTPKSRAPTPCWKPRSRPAPRMSSPTTTVTRSSPRTDTLREVAKALEAKFGEPRKSALLWKPQNTVAVDDEAGEKLLRMIEALDESDDVQNVYANFEVSDALVQKMSA